MRNTGRALLLVMLAVVLSACAATIYRVPPNPSNPVYTVAVLPVYNATNDVEGPMLVREEFTSRLEGRHYRIMPAAEVDRILADRMGITLGDQLEMTDPQTLGEMLGVDGVVYGWLLNFDDITTGIYNARKVRAGFRLVETRTGSTLWAGGLGVKNIIAGGDVGVGIAAINEISGRDREVLGSIKGLDGIPGLDQWHIIRAQARNDVGEAAAVAIGTKLLSKALGVHLVHETSVMLNRVTRDFPAGPGSPRYMDYGTRPAEY